MVTRKVDVTNLLAFDLNTATCCLSYQVFLQLSQIVELKSLGPAYRLWS